MKTKYLCTDSMKTWVLAAFVLMIGSLQTAIAETTCPSDAAKPFVGKWQGSAILIPAQAAQQQMGSRARLEILDCQSFHIEVNYLDSAGNVARTVQFKASADPEQEGLFTVMDGSVTDASGVNPQTGTFKLLQEGTLLGTFIGAIGGKPAYMTELLNVSASPNGERHLVRTVQMFAGRQGGEYLGTRVVNDTEVK